MLRNEVREAEEHPSRIGEILNRQESAEDFINLYLKRNPKALHPEFLKFYRTLSVSSQVILYKEAKEMVEDEDFEYECVMKYCIDERSALFENIIRNIKNSKMLFRILANNFLCPRHLDVDFDLHVTKCLVLALSIHSIDKDEMKTLISAVGKHLSDHRRKYYEHGATVASVLLETAGFDIGCMEEAQKVPYIPDRLMELGGKEKFRNPKDVFASYKEVKNDPDRLKSLWRPRYLQEGIKILLDEKDIDKIEAVFKHFPELVSSATERVLKFRSMDALHALMNYDGYEEYKVKDVCELLKKSFSFIAAEVLDEFFCSRLCLRSKIILAFVFRRVIDEGTYEQAKFLHCSISFMYRRIQGELPKLLQDNLEGLLIEGTRRLVSYDKKMNDACQPDLPAGMDC